VVRAELHDRCPQHTTLNSALNGSVPHFSASVGRCDFDTMSRSSHTSARFSRHQDSAMSLPKTPPDESTLTRYFRAGNHRGIATCLDQLKNDPKRCKEFVKRTNLDILVRLLRCENHRIVDRSLSILADACMTDDVRKKVCSVLAGTESVTDAFTLEVGFL